MYIQYTTLLAPCLDRHPAGVCDGTCAASSLVDVPLVPATAPQFAQARLRLVHTDCTVTGYDLDERLFDVRSHPFCIAAHIKACTARYPGIQVTALLADAVLHVDLRVAVAAEREVEPRQKARMAQLRATRDGAAVQRTLVALEAAARGSENLVPHLLDCARAYCTLHEIRHAMEKVFGSYKEPVFF